MKKTFIIAVLALFTTVMVDAQLVSTTTVSNTNPNSICQKQNHTQPGFCKDWKMSRYPCDLCPVCENGQLVTCNENSGPNDKCCIPDVKVSHCGKIQAPKCSTIWGPDGDFKHPCSKCPVCYAGTKEYIQCKPRLNGRFELFPCCDPDDNGDSGDKGNKPNAKPIKLGPKTTAKNAVSKKSNK